MTGSDDRPADALFADLAPLADARREAAHAVARTTADLQRAEAAHQASKGELETTTSALDQMARLAFLKLCDEILDSAVVSTRTGRGIGGPPEVHWHLVHYPEEAVSLAGGMVHSFTTPRTVPYCSVTAGSGNAQFCIATPIALGDDRVPAAVRSVAERNGLPPTGLIVNTGWQAFIGSKAEQFLAQVPDVASHAEFVAEADYGRNLSGGKYDALGAVLTEMSTALARSRPAIALRAADLATVIGSGPSRVLG